MSGIGNCEALVSTYKINLREQTGLDYRGARFYDSEVGRFLSLDPESINYPSYSDYSYVAGNPIVFIDPNGEDIVFFNNKGSELARIKTEAEDEITIDIENELEKPLIIDPQELLNNMKDQSIGKLDAVGFGIEASTTFIGGINIGLEAVYYLSGENEGDIWLYDKVGGNIGAEASAGGYVFGAVKTGNSPVSADSWLGIFNSYSLGYAAVGGSYFWSAESGDIELYPGHKSDTDWQGITFSGAFTAGPKIGGKWSASDYSYAEWAGDDGLLRDNSENRFNIKNGVDDVPIMMDGVANAVY